ncbi:MAG: type II secretion system F family protein [Planctomycetes bacterium]|nr:type II secretion system F family protein [Planctomycetota bacterium]
MAVFQYQALTQAGRLMKGTLEAGSPSEASDLLGQMQLTVQSVEKATPPKARSAIGRSEFVLFNQQLASIAKAGIPLERGLRELSHDIASPKMRRLIEAIATDLEAGMDIQEAFEKRQRDLPPLYGRILKAGVETGRLSEMLTSLNRHLEMGSRTRRIIFEAMAYPGMVLIFTAIIITGAFTYIIPQFESILAEMVGGELNMVTTLFLDASHHVIPFWTVFGTVLAGGALILMGMSHSAGGRRLRETMLMRVPVIGKIYHDSLIGRLSEAMALMVVSGCDIPQGLRLAADATGSAGLIRETEVLAARVEEGTAILEAGQFCRMIPRLFLYSMQLGIQRNELQDNLHSLSDMYTSQAGQGQGRLQSLLMPTMVVFVGGVLGMAVLAIFLPMIQVITGLSSG